MSLKESDRSELIKYRLEQAVEEARLCDLLIDHDKTEIAASRIYYGFFYALMALGIKYKFSTSKHLQLIGWFNKNFVHKGVTSNEHGKNLRNAYRCRIKGDYEAYVSFSISEVRNMQKDLIDFISEIKRIIDHSPKT